MTLPSEIAGRLLKLPRPLSRDLTVERDIAIPMDDGVTLLADRYAIKDAPPGPTVLVRSPYGRKGPLGLLFGRLLAERGLQTVVQSTRGSFGSGGEFDPFNERADGLATLRWLRAQPWHDGKVGTFGASYMGLVQWAIADELDAIAAQVTASQFRGMAYGAGPVSLDTTLTWLLILSAQEDRLGMLRIARGIRRTLPELFGELPLGDLDRRAFGREIPYFRKWLTELAPDSPYWADRDFSSGVGSVTAPVQLIGGWTDIFLPWQVEDWHALRDADRTPQLIVGPWSHMSEGLLATSLREGIAWLRAHLLGDERLVRTTPVRVYVTGERRWRDLADWPPPGAREHTLHLHAGGALRTDAPQNSDRPSRFRYDPNDPTPALGGPRLMDTRAVVDNRDLEQRPDVLTFTSDPLDRDLDAIGPVNADIRARPTPGDADVFVRICDVHPDGRSLNVTDGLIRITPETPERDEDGTATVTFTLWPAAHRFAQGHRIRVQVAGGAHPRYARNPGTGEDPATATHLQAVDHEVRHDARHPSSVTLTVADDA